MVGTMKGRREGSRLLSSPDPDLPLRGCVGGRRGSEAQKVEVADADAKRLDVRSLVGLVGLPPLDPNLDLNQFSVSENA